MDETAAPPGAPHPRSTARSDWTPAANPTPTTAKDWERITRSWLIMLALVVLSLSLLTALIAANQAVTIWLQPQYAPFVRTAGALVVAALALYVVLRLTRHPRH